MDIYEIYYVLNQHYPEVIADMEKQNLLCRYICLESIKSIIHQINKRSISGSIFVLNEKDAKDSIGKEELPQGDCWLIYNMKNPISQSIKNPIVTYSCYLHWGIVGIKIY